MAKKVKIGQKQKRNNNGYFTQNIQALGKDFLNRKNAMDIQRDANRIFNDIARNSIDLERDYKYFEDATFVQNLLIVAQDNLNYHWATLTGLNQFLMMYPDSDQSYYMIRDMHQKSVEAYTLYVQALNSILSGNNIYCVLQMLIQMMQQKYNRGNVLNNTFIVRDDSSRRIETLKNERRNINDQRSGNFNQGTIQG